MSQVLTVAIDGQTLSNLIWRRYRKPMPGLVEKVQALNPGLAGLGLVLSRGTAVILPDDVSAPPRTDVVQLWE